MQNFRYQGTASDAAALEGIVSAMTRHQSNAHIQECLCKLLSKIAENDEQSRLWATQAGAIQAVFKVIDTHANSTFSVFRAYWALDSIMQNFRYQGTASDAAALEGIVSAMTRHQSNAHIQECLCKLLSKIAENDEQSRLWATQAGAIQAVFKVIDTHANSTFSVFRAYWALDSIMQNFRYQGTASDAAALEGIVSAMTRHQSNAHIQECLCKLLSKIAENDEQSRLWATQAGAIQAVEAKLREMREEEIDDLGWAGTRYARLRRAYSSSVLPV
ncbi:hypothetical protein GUITHDRAFT_139395 [Guillardia theta CCMP2712]|uniref:Uncharacterized protein n=1 Tax=Guillardia theta (strain CCMP2712) TaxID=905079 RepID=L1J894_GUITC|nr:hypothetical protein GUITHDRAFT_139395 [Guillardia theta CCMP2712]EKX44761.1 hypothetical protein GUITHDRAFT_139395 [Guillardia theta CCMP2712]|eukprot:XP_005831741.1 hypothetical protein GUITHDRAFT_139395 [Guillardia theta CCMP2712]